MFAFQVWSSAIEMQRYMLRFIQEFERLETLGGIIRTPLNQYECMILPLTTKLKELGVKFEMGCTISDVDVDT